MSNKPFHRLLAIKLIKTFETQLRFFNHNEFWQASKDVVICKKKCGQLPPAIKTGKPGILWINKVFAQEDKRSASCENERKGF